MDVKQLAARLARECSNQRIEFSDVTAHLFTPAQLETLVRLAMVEAYKDALASCEATEKDELRGLDCTEYMRKRIKELA